MKNGDEGCSFVIQVKDRFRSCKYKDRQPTTHACIYRVPKYLMDCKPKAYVPEVVSFGPFHYKRDQKLSAMDDHKLEAVSRTLKRLNNFTFDKLIGEVRKLDKQVRDCYEDNAIEYDENTLALILTMDACFILEFWRAGSNQPGLCKSDSFSLVFKSDWNLISWEITRDIIKLENQIPMFVLSKILQLESPSVNQDADSLLARFLNSSSFKQYTIDFIFTASAKHVLSQEVMVEYISGGACHLLDLFTRMTRDVLTFPNSQPSFSGARSKTTNSESGNNSTIPTVELLQKVGIKFKASKDGNVLFKKGMFGGSSILYLPQLRVADSTETLLRNLMAFEECRKYREENVISRYFSLMNGLIDSARDVTLLIEKGIIENWVGSDDEIATMINNLDNGMTTARVKAFKEVAQEVRQHYNSKVNAWIYQFKQEHCSKPWYLVSFLVAITILIMTITQTVYTIRNG